MRKIDIINEPSLYRDNFRVRGFVFGEGKKSVCVVGPMRGNEYQQQYIATLFINRLKQIEDAGELCKGIEILVIPTVNPFSFNTKKRFCAMDNSDFNRIFPGNKNGETSERITDAVFSVVKQYPIGIQLSSYYASGSFLSHVKIMKTQNNYTKMSKEFGMPYVVLHDPRPFEKGTLNYNWQMVGTDAFTLYSTSTTYIERNSAHLVSTSMLRFLKNQNLIKTEILGGYVSEILDEEKNIISVRNEKAGFFQPLVKVGFEVEKGDLLAEIHDPYDGTKTADIFSPATGVVFFMHSDPLAYSHSAVFKLILSH